MRRSMRCARQPASHRRHRWQSGSPDSSTGTASTTHRTPLRTGKPGRDDRIAPLPSPRARRSKSRPATRMILVTGGAGFIGANFVLDWLSHSGEPVVNLDKLTYAGNLGNLESVQRDARHAFVRGDIGDAALVGDLLRTHRPRAVLNFAAESHVDRSIAGPGAFIETNVAATLRLLEAVRAHLDTLPAQARDAFRFVHVSTDEVYGSLAPDAPGFSETTPYAPNSPYSASKAASDHLMRAWHHTYGL